MENTARVSTNGFSNPTVMTRNGSASPSRTGLIAMSRNDAARSAKRKARHDDMSAQPASQMPDERELGLSEPERRRMLRKSETKVECMSRYASSITKMSALSACCASA